MIETINNYVINNLNVSRYDILTFNHNIVEGKSEGKVTIEYKTVDKYENNVLIFELIDDKYGSVVIDQAYFPITEMKEERYNSDLVNKLKEEVNKQVAKDGNNKIIRILNLNVRGIDCSIEGEILEDIKMDLRSIYGRLDKINSASSRVETITNPINSYKGIANIIVYYSPNGEDIKCESKTALFTCNYKGNQLESLEDIKIGKWVPYKTIDIDIEKTQDKIKDLVIKINNLDKEIDSIKRLGVTKLRKTQLTFEKFKEVDRRERERRKYENELIHLSPILEESMIWGMITKFNYKEFYTKDDLHNKVKIYENKAIEIDNIINRKYKERKILKDRQLIKEVIQSKIYGVESMINTLNEYREICLSIIEMEGKEVKSREDLEHEVNLLINENHPYYGRLTCTNNKQKAPITKDEWEEYKRRELTRLNMKIKELKLKHTIQEDTDWVTIQWDVCKHENIKEGCEDSWIGDLYIGGAKFTGRFTNGMPNGKDIKVILNYGKENETVFEGRVDKGRIREGNYTYKNNEGDTVTNYFEFFDSIQSHPKFYKDRLKEETVN